MQSLRPARMCGMEGAQELSSSVVVRSTPRTMISLVRIIPAFPRLDRRRFSLGGAARSEAQLRGDIAGPSSDRFPVARVALLSADDVLHKKAIDELEPAAVQAASEEGRRD